jgi:glutamate formiminotransferase / formiminotetrahydrofolate cyclodeaminase
VTGARFFLIAYNVNILGTKNQAHRLALNVREQGRTVKGPDGAAVRQPGYFKAVKGIGWELEEFDLAQVSMNLDNYRITPIHAVFEAIERDAAELNVGVAGSEIVGLVPLEAILRPPTSTSRRKNLFILDERQKVRLAIDRLGLSSIHPFRPEEKIIEYMIEGDEDGPLIRQTVRGFVEAVGARSSAPGGGSVAALMGSLGAALGAMGGWLTYGRRKYEHLDAAMRQALPPLVEVQEALLRAVDADTDAFADFMDALRCRRRRTRRRRGADGHAGGAEEGHPRALPDHGAGGPRVGPHAGGGPGRSVLLPLRRGGGGEGAGGVPLRRLPQRRHQPGRHPG